MSRHGEYVADDSKRIRFVKDDSGSLVRILVHQNWYKYVKSLYDYIELLTSTVSVSINELPAYLKDIQDWINHLSIEWGYNNAVVSISIILAVTWAVKRKISLGKFAYQMTGYGVNYGVDYGGSGTLLVELPVKG
jgi:hypothetical protein